MLRLLLTLFIFSSVSYGATIAIIDTGFDLDHEFLRPKIFKQETDEEAIDPQLSKKFHGWDFHDNSHLKTPIITDQSMVQEILLYRNLRAKGHREGLSPEEFEWFSKKRSDKEFIGQVKQFKKHSHGTLVAGIALREGENITIFPIRGLNIPIPVVAVTDSEAEVNLPNRGRTPEEKFKGEIKNSLERVTQKFSKICSYLSSKKIEVVNASYGITYKNIMTRFQEIYRDIFKKEITPEELKMHVDEYFAALYLHGNNTLKRYPKMLFIFSAGNSGLNNDEFHHYPSRIKLPNTMAIAATNGDYLASFSNFGLGHVDIGAPGVGILSLVPKVYSTDGTDLYSPSSGTSMAAPHISNLAAQIINSNKKLKPFEVKKIILETGNEMSHLKSKITSGAVVNNQKALKAALLSRDMPLDEAINLARLDIIPMEDKISIGLGPAISPEDVKKKILESFPVHMTSQDVDEDEPEEATKSLSSELKDPVIEQPDKSALPPSKPQAPQDSPVDQVLPNQNEEQSQKPSGEEGSSSSELQSSLPEAQSPDSFPSLPQS